MARRQTEAPLFSKGQPLPRGGATRVDLRRWSYVGLALALVGLAGWLYLEQASVVASYGYEIRQLESRKERLRRELTALRGEVAALGSLERILALGEQMGYTMPDVTDPSTYLTVRYLAPADAVEAEAPPAEPPQAEEERAGAVGWMRRAVTTLGAWLGLSVGVQAMD